MQRLILHFATAIALLLPGCASIQVPPLVEAVAGEGGSDTARLRQRLDTHLRGLEADGYSGAVLVVRGDELVLSEGYGIADRKRGLVATDQTLFQLASVTKQFTAAAILKLEMAGKLRVSDPVTRFFADVPADKRAITIHQLLTHTSGLPHRVGTCSLPAAETDRDDYVRQVLAADLHSSPGEAYLYSNDGYGLLGAIIERASGTTYEHYLRASLFTPARMTRTGYSFDDATLADAARGYDREDEYTGNLNPAFRNASGPAWCNRASGGLLSTAGDMRRWLAALRGTGILSRKAKNALFHPHVPESPEAASFHGYGWALFTTPRQTRLAAHDGSLSGYFTADLHWYLDEDVAFFVASNSVEHEAQRISKAVARIIFDNREGR